MARAQSPLSHGVLLLNSEELSKFIANERQRRAGRAQGQLLELAPLPAAPLGNVTSTRRFFLRPCSEVLSAIG